MTTSDFIVIDSGIAASEIAEVSTNEDDEVSLSSTSYSSLGENLKVGSIVTVVPGVDDRFPFGLSGEVSSTTTNSDGSATITLEEATLVDVIYSADQETSLALNADNFIGVIAPSATQATEEASAAYTSIATASYSRTKQAINGGVIIRNSAKSSALSQGFAASDVIVLGDGGHVDLNLTVSLAEMGIDVSDIDDDAAFIITGSIDNLMLEHVLDFTGYKLNELKEIISGDIDLEVKINASGSINLGYYSDAWDEVEEIQAEILGQSGKLTGLDGKDKVGKFPLVGLVWSIPCPDTCPATLGDTETSVELAKLGGVIVWVYLDAKGTITLDGEFGSRVNSAEFEVGVEKPVDEDLKPVYNLVNIGDERLLELPYIDGSVSLEARAGVALDVDAFTLGVRLANASAELAGNYSTNFEGALSYGTYGLDEDWSWEGDACITTNYGAGMIFSANVNAGVEIDTSVWDWDWDGISYYRQWPTEEEIETSGWHGMGDFKFWYKADGRTICFPNSEISSMSLDHFEPGIEMRPDHHTVAGVALSPDQSKLYAAHWQSGTTVTNDPIAVYSTEDYSLIDQIPGGSCVGDVIVSNNGRYVYGTTYYGGYVSRYDTWNSNTKTTIDLGSWANKIWKFPGGEKAIVNYNAASSSPSTSHYLALIDISGDNFSVMDTINAGKPLYNGNIAFSEDMAHIYIGSYSNTEEGPSLIKVSIYDDTLSIVDSIELTDGANEDKPTAGVAYSNGRIYIGDNINNKIYIVDENTFSLIDEILLPYSPKNIALHPDGQHLFILYNDMGILSAVDLLTEDTVFSLTDLNVGLYDIEFSDDGTKAYTAHYDQIHGGVSFISIDNE